MLGSSLKLALSNKFPDVFPASTKATTPIDPEHPSSSMPSFLDSPVEEELLSSSSIDISAQPTLSDSPEPVAPVRIEPSEEVVEGDFAADTPMPDVDHESVVHVGLFDDIIEKLARLTTTPEHELDRVLLLETIRSYCSQYVQIEDTVADPTEFCQVMSAILPRVGKGHRHGTVHFKRFDLLAVLFQMLISSSPADWDKMFRLLRQLDGLVGEIGFSLMHFLGR